MKLTNMAVVQFFKSRPRSFYKLCVLCVFKTLLASMLAMVIGSMASVDKAHAQSNSGGGGLTQAMGLVTTGLNIYAGVALMKTCPTTAVNCALGAMAFGSAAQSVMSATSGAETKGGFSNTASDFDWKGNMDDDVRKTLDTLGLDTPEDAEKFANDQLKNLKNKGFKVNPDGTVTTPKGTFPASAFASGASMADAGIISPDEIAGVDSTIKSLSDKFKVSAVGIAGGGGGGGGSGSGGSYKYSYDESAGAGSYGFGDKPGAPKTSGLTRTLASGEAIGSSTDNIFEMVHRNYQEKSEEKIFVGQEEP